MHKIYLLLFVCIQSFKVSNFFCVFFLNYLVVLFGIFVMKSVHMSLVQAREFFPCWSLCYIFMTYYLPYFVFSNTLLCLLKAQNSYTCTKNRLNFFIIKDYIFTGMNSFAVDMWVCWHSPASWCHANIWNIFLTFTPLFILAMCGYIKQKNAWFRKRTARIRGSAFWPHGPGQYKRCFSWPFWDKAKAY